MFLNPWRVWYPSSAGHRSRSGPPSRSLTRREGAIATCSWAKVSAAVARIDSRPSAAAYGTYSGQGIGNSRRYSRASSTTRVTDGRAINSEK
jgi:hypothetical protein